jgi:hypothetical protein
MGVLKYFLCPCYRRYYDVDNISDYLTDEEKAERQKRIALARRQNDLKAKNPETAPWKKYEKKINPELGGDKAVVEVNFVSSHVMYSDVLLLCFVLLISLSFDYLSIHRRKLRRLSANVGSVRWGARNGGLSAIGIQICSINSAPLSLELISISC